MKTTIIGSFVALVLLNSIPGAGHAAEATVKPNILFILCDDLGINDLHCYGRQDHHTPNLDRLRRLVQLSPETLNDLLKALVAAGQVAMLKVNGESVYRMAG